MAPLERLFALEPELHCRPRDEDRDAAALHTSDALQAGYEPLSRGVGRIAFTDIDRLTRRRLAAAYPREMVAAREAPARLLGVAPPGT